MSMDNSSAPPVIIFLRIMGALGIVLPLVMALANVIAYGNSSEPMFSGSNVWLAVFGGFAASAMLFGVAFVAERVASIDRYVNRTGPIGGKPDSPSTGDLLNLRH